MSNDTGNQVPGDLIIDTRTLELNGSFEGIKSGAFGGLAPGIRTAHKDVTILGVARNGGKKYTLEFFDEPSFTITMPGYKADAYQLGNIFEGNHFSKTEKLSFERYYIELPYLLEWVNDGIISIQTTFEKGEPLKLKNTVVTIEAPKSLLVYKQNDLEISFSFSLGSLPMTPPLRDIHITQGCSLKLESKKGIEFSEARALAAHIERLLTVAVGKNIAPIRFQMSSGQGTSSRAVTLRNVTNDANLHKKSLHITEMNFNFDDIKNESQMIFEKWLNDKDKHADMFDLFSSIQSDRPRTLNNQFLEIVSAIEGYVRVESGDLSMSLIKTIKTLNEYLPKSDRPLSTTDYENIRITRNKLSHIALEKPQDETKVLNDDGKVIAIYKLKILLEYGLLKNLGLTGAQLAAFYKKRKAHY